MEGLEGAELPPGGREVVLQVVAALLALVAEQAPETGDGCEEV